MRHGSLTQLRLANYGQIRQPPQNTKTSETFSDLIDKEINQEKKKTQARFTLPIVSPCVIIPRIKTHQIKEDRTSSVGISSQKLPFTNYTTSRQIHIWLMRSDSGVGEGEGVVRISVGRHDPLSATR